MPRRRLHGPRLIAVFLLGLAAFNYPLVAVLDRLAWVGGWPAQFVWLMAAWLLVIVLLGRADAGGRAERPEAEKET